MAWDFYALLGLRGLTLQLNSIGCQLCHPDYLEKLRQYYSGHAQALCPDCRRRLWQNALRLLDCKKPSCQEIAKSAPKIAEHLCHQCASHFDALKGHLEGLQIPYELNPYLVRGLDYYTRTVFEIQPKVGGAQSALGGGGRYDGLIEQLEGTPAPAIGFATGLERIILNLRHQAIDLPPIPGPKVYVAYLGEDAKKEAIKLAAKLRQAGIGATLALGEKSLKSQLKQANSLALPQALIIGENELKKGMAVLRDMARGEQVEIPLQQIAARLKREA
jgi:histidyl-tRNA synthetase